MDNYSKIINETQVDSILDTDSDNPIRNGAVTEQFERQRNALTSLHQGLSQVKSDMEDLAFEVEGKLDKVTTFTSSDQVYTKSASGTQTMLTVSSGSTASSIAQRTPGGQLSAASPSSNNHLVTLQYANSHYNRHITVVYGMETFSDVQEAYNAGYTVRCMTLSPVEEYPLVRCTNSTAYFVQVYRASSLDPLTISIVKVDSSGWSTQTVNVSEEGHLNISGTDYQLRTGTSGSSRYITFVTED